MRAAFFASLVAVIVGCTGPTDDPGNVRDLRVLGVRVEPPELMAPTCVLDAPTTLATFAQAVRYSALIADGQGTGRSITYELRACARDNDWTCNNAGETVSLASGATTDGELNLTINPAGALVESGDGGTEQVLLLQRVAEFDSFGGLGGIRIPLVLRLKAGDEEIFAQKLMVYSCKLFPNQTQNVNPSIPSVLLNDEAWDEGVARTLGPSSTYQVSIGDYAALQENYVVPSLALRPVNLTESWKFNWFADFGSMSPNETGGTDLGGQESRNRSRWRVPEESLRKQQRDVRFWFVVRDGRGGQSWALRQGRFVP